MREKNAPEKLGPLARDVSDAMRGIVENALESAAAALEVRCQVPEGFVRPEAKPGEPAKQGRKPGALSVVLSAAVPAVLAASGVVLNLPVAAVAALSGVGGVLGGCANRTGGAGDKSGAKKTQGASLKSEDVSVRIVVNEEKKRAMLESAMEKIGALSSEISGYEQKMQSRHDIAIDTGFGEWVQQFLLYADGRPDDRKLQRMRDELVAKLRRMKIHVYDEVRLGESGKPDVPVQDYLIDSREGAAYTRVTVPAVYSDRAVLARGEIE